jgi:hypothetical protein
MAHQLLITTPGAVLHLDVEMRRLHVIEEGRIEYYGASWPTDGSALVLGHSVTQNYGDLEAVMNSEVGYVSVGDRASDPWLSFPHQILCQGTDVVLVANTLRNALVRMRLDDLSMRQRRYDGAMWDTLGTNKHPGAHFNSIFRRDDTVYLLAHNNGRPSYVHELDADTLDLKRTVSSRHYTGLHNLWVTAEGRYLACHSLSGAIIDLKTDEVFCSTHSTTFTRGMASDGRLLFVGGSTPGSRETRRDSESGLWIIDLATRRVLDYVNLGNFGNVKEVRLINLPDLCHHGHPLQESAIRFVREETLPSGGSELGHATNPLDFDEWRPLIGSVHRDDRGRLKSFPATLGVATVVDVEASDVRITATAHQDKPVGHLSLLARVKGVEPAGEAYAAMLYGKVAAGAFWKTVDRTWTKVVDKVAPDLSWPVEMVFELIGTRLTLTLNGKLVLDLEDDAIAGNGAVGVRLMDDGLRLENFRVEVLKP